MEIELSLRRFRQLGRYYPKYDRIVIPLRSVLKNAKWIYRNCMGERWNINRDKCFRIFVSEFTITVVHEVLHHYFCRELDPKTRKAMNVQAQEAAILDLIHW